MTDQYCHLTGKVAYDDRPAAEAIMSHMKKRPGNSRSVARLNVFRCSACGHWHVGNRDRSERFERRVRR